VAFQTDMAKQEVLNFRIDTGQTSELEQADETEIVIIRVFLAVSD